MRRERRNQNIVFLRSQLWVTTLTSPGPPEKYTECLLGLSNYSPTASCSQPLRLPPETWAVLVRRPSGLLWHQRRLGADSADTWQVPEMQLCKPSVIKGVLRTSWRPALTALRSSQVPR